MYEGCCLHYMQPMACVIRWMQCAPLSTLIPAGGCSLQDMIGPQGDASGSMRAAPLPVTDVRVPLHC